ncbi:MAG: hypothetical protein U0361_17970 [Nitrospiraceae bacterium]
MDSQASEIAAVNILLVDDHAIVRKGLRQVLAEELPSPTFGEAGSAAGMQQALTKHKYGTL